MFFDIFFASYLRHGGRGSSSCAFVFVKNGRFGGEVRSLFCFLFSLSHLLSSPSLLLSHNPDPGSHLQILLPPLPATVRALHFYREKSSALSSLVHSRLRAPHEILVHPLPYH